MLIKIRGELPRSGLLEPRSAVDFNLALLGQNQLTQNVTVKEIKELKNEICWAVIAGKGTGSIFNLKIGEKIPMSKPLTNPHLSEDARNYNSKYGIMVYSSWELTKNGEIVCDSNDSNENDGPMVTGLKELENQKIKKISLTEEFHELDIYFTGNYTLEVFCDGQDIGEDYENYTIYLPTETLTVEADYKIKRETVTSDFT